MLSGISSDKFTLQVFFIIFVLWEQASLLDWRTPEGDFDTLRFHWLPGDCKKSLSTRDLFCMYG